MPSHESTPGDPAHFAPAWADALEALLALVREYYAFDGIPFDDAAVRRGLAELLTDASLGGAWIIRRGDDAIGYLVLTYGFDLELGGRQATVTELYLRPRARSPSSRSTSGSSGSAPTSSTSNATTPRPAPSTLAWAWSRTTGSR